MCDYDCTIISYLLVINIFYLQTKINNEMSYETELKLLFLFS